MSCCSAKKNEITVRILLRLIPSVNGLTHSRYACATPHITDIFYQICRGASDDQKRRWGVSSVESYRYLKSDSSVILKTDKAGVTTELSDAKQFAELIAKMKQVGFSDNEMDSIFTIVAAVLNMGNILFVSSEAKNDKSPAKIAPPAAADTKDGATSSEAALVKVATSLGWTRQSLEQCFLNKKMTSRGEVFWSPQPASVANNTRDGLAKVRCPLSSFVRFGLGCVVLT